MSTSRLLLLASTKRKDDLPLGQGQDFDILVVEARMQRFVDENAILRTALNSIILFVLASCCNDRKVSNVSHAVTIYTGFYAAKH